MKRVILLLALFAINALVAQTTTSSNQNSSEQVNTPATVLANFKKKYANVSPAWQMDGDNYCAKYRDQATNLDHIIVYNQYGNLIHSDDELDYESYLKPITDYFATTYPKEQYTVWSCEDDAGNISYFSKRSSGNMLWFDKDGNYSATKPVGTNKISSH
ncbi:MAG: hypothetical protein H0U95_07580 [Bacteroidetes bacterium]|nr:hypothetical protein [Bacteroidota bacterium]